MGSRTHDLNFDVAPERLAHLNVDHRVDQTRVHDRGEDCFNIGAGQWPLGRAECCSFFRRGVGYVASSSMSTTIMSIQEHREPQTGSMHREAMLSMIKGFLLSLCTFGRFGRSSSFGPSHAYTSRCVAGLRLHMCSARSSLLSDTSHHRVCWSSGSALHICSIFAVEKGLVQHGREWEGNRTTALTRRSYFNSMTKKTTQACEQLSKQANKQTSNRSINHLVHLKGRAFPFLVSLSSSLGSWFLFPVSYFLLGFPSPSSFLFVCFLSLTICAQFWPCLISHESHHTWVWVLCGTWFRAYSSTT